MGLNFGQQHLQQPKASLENLSQVPEKKTKILRPGMANKIRAAVTAGLIGLGGAMTSGNAEAQQVRVGSVEDLEKVGAVVVVNNILRAFSTPVRIGMVNGQPIVGIDLTPKAPPRPPTKPFIEKEAQELLTKLGYVYDNDPPLIYSLKNPNSRINFSQLTSEIRITKATEGEAVLVNRTYFDEQNRRYKQKVVFGKGDDGQPTFWEVVNQPA